MQIAHLDIDILVYGVFMHIAHLFQLSIHGNYLNEEVHLSTGFVSKPELKVHVRPRTFSQVSQVGGSTWWPSPEVFSIFFSDDLSKRVVI